MGIENSGSKPIQQGEAGYLTQDQLDEMHAADAVPEKTDSTTESAPVTAVEEMDDSFVRLATEVAPTAPLSPERRTEVMGQIGEQESHLTANLQRTDELMSSAEKRLSDTSAPESRQLVTSAKISEAYNKTNDRLLILFTVGAAGSNAAVIGGFVAGDHARVLNQAMDMQEMMTNHWQHIAENLVSGGTIAGVATMGLLGIGKSLAWLKKRSQEKKLYA